MPKTTSALEKGFAVLEVLRDSQVPLTLTAIAELTGVVPSSAHATLNHLHKLDAVRLTEHKRYTLGPAVHFLGASYARATPLYRSVWIELVNVANELGVTAAIAVEWKRRHLILNAHRGPGSDVAVPFGGSIPLTAASWGKVYFAWSGADLPDTLSAHTANSITDVALFKDAVDAVRERGYATDLEEYYVGVQGVSAAVTSANGYEGLAAFLGAKSAMERLGIDTVGERVRRIADRASNSLGDADRMRLFGSE